MRSRPLAGTIALGLVREAGPLYGRHVLLIGASGGVGRSTVGLGAAQGARMTVVTRSAPGPVAHPAALRSAP